MKVAIVSSTFSAARPNGVATYVRGRSEYLAGRCDVSVFALGPTSSVASTSGVREVVVGDYKFFKYSFVWVWLKIIWFLIKEKPTHIEVHNIPVGLPVLLLFRPYYYFHGPASLEASIEGLPVYRIWLAHFLEVFALIFARTTCVASKCFSDIALDTHPLIRRFIRIRVRYPKVIFSAPATIDTQRRAWRPVNQFVCVRRLVKRTGVFELIIAFTRGLSSGRVPASSMLTIVGEGPELQRIQQYVSRSPWGANIRLLGRVSDEERSRLFLESDWNIVPTRGLEGFGLVVVEAALLGCPSLVTRVGALPEVIELLSGMGQVCGVSIAEIEKSLSLLHPPSEEYRKCLAIQARRRFGV